MWAGALGAKPCGGRNVQQEMGGGTNGGVLAAILAGAGDRAKETCTPRHISPCGPPAAQISYLKPDQICREQACNTNQLSLLRVLIKQTPVTHGRLGARMVAKATSEIFHESLPQGPADRGRHDL